MTLPNWKKSVKCKNDEIATSFVIFSDWPNTYNRRHRDYQPFSVHTLFPWTHKQTELHVMRFGCGRGRNLPLWASKLFCYRVIFVVSGAVYFFFVMTSCMPQCWNHTDRGSWTDTRGKTEVSQSAPAFQADADWEKLSLL